MIIGYSRANVVAYSAEAEAFFARLATQPDATRGSHYNTMISSLVADGIWAKLDALYIFAAADAPTALTNLISSSFGGTVSGAPAFAANAGYTGGSTKYIDTAFDPTGGGLHFVQDSATVFGWSLTSTGVDGVLVGKLNELDTILSARWSDDMCYARINTVVASTSAAATDGAGLFTMTRRGATEQELYRNASSIATSATASSAPVGDTFTFLQSATTFWFTGQIAAGGIGSGMSDTEVADLYDAIHVYLQAVAGVP